MKQARYCMKFLNNDKSLPSTAEMFQSVENHIAGRRAEGIPKRKWHKLGILGQVGMILLIRNQNF